MTLLTVPDLFRRYRGKETGHWRVGNESVRTVHLDSGDIVFASSTFQSDRLTTILVESGKLTQGQMEHALSNLKPGMSVGKNLIEMGFITQRDLLDAARFQVERIVWSALTAPETPTFEPKDDLEENVVRLPLDTPALLFKGIMRIVDRESLLELLGPLNQVVFLQGKRVFELDLPADLAKVAPLMDGTHTILELGSEVAVEPMRVGAFALFLREIGWGKLYELPPIDRQALNRALTVNDPTKPPSSFPAQRSELFRTIEEAGKKTVQLDQLSSLLDDIENTGYNEESDKTAKESQPETESPRPIREESDSTQPDSNNPVGRVLTMPPEPEPLEESLSQEEPTIIISPEEPTDIPYPPTIIDNEEIKEESEEKSKKKVERESKKAEKEAEREREKAEREAERERKKAERESKKAEQRAEKERKKAEKEAERAIRKAEKANKKAENKAGEESVTAGKSWIRTLLYVIIALPVVFAAIYCIREFKLFKTRNIDPPFTITPSEVQPSEPPSAAATETESEPSSTSPVPSQAETPVPLQAKPNPTQLPQPPRPSPPPVVDNTVDTSTQARFGAIADGNTNRALTQGKAFQASLSRTTWIIRLIVACQGETLQNCAHELNALRPDLFLASLRLRDGRLCYQLFMGCYSTKGAAETEVKRLPALFKEKGQMPKIMQVSDITAQQ